MTDTHAPEEDDELSVTAHFTTYPQPSADGESETITFRQVALGMTPCILIEADTEQDEPTFIVNISEIPMEAVAMLLENFGRQLSEHLEQQQAAELSE
jgi:hypothetical protein